MAEINENHFMAGARLKLCLHFLLLVSIPAWGHDCEDGLRVPRHLESLSAANRLFWSAHSREKLRRTLAPGHFISQALPTFEWPEVEPAFGMSTTPLAYAPRSSLQKGPKIYYSEGVIQHLTRKFGLQRSEYLLDVAGAHEVGHHIQLLMGISSASFANPNEGFFRLELMADCLAGVFLRHHNKEWLDPYLQVIPQSGSDRTLKHPPAFIDSSLIRARKIHPFGQTRERWFLLGWESGAAEICDSLKNDLDDLL